MKIRFRDATTRPWAAKAGSCQRSNRTTPLGLMLLLGVLLLTLAGCRGKSPAVTPTAPVVNAETPEALPAVESAVMIDPQQGGVVALSDGAQANLPPQSISAKATASLKSIGTVPVVPIPRDLVGRAYELKLDGAELTGVALLRLPLPPDVTPGQYDVAPYRWNGKAWERINGRNIGNAIQFGANLPGIYALQAQWNLADASLALARPESSPGQQTVSLAVAGQYRYSVIPTLQGDYVHARLILKQDTSGGAGRVTGNDTLDKTVDEAELFFKPNSTQAQGVIEFSQVFSLAPGTLALAPGDTTRFYVVLTVSDSAAPTRRLSTSIEYTQILPIQAVGGAIVRPELTGGKDSVLRWHVRFNGQTFLIEPAAETQLPLDPILAKGGLGEYRFTLEASKDNNWIPVSNDVTVLLALAPTATPEPGTVMPSAGTQIAITSPTPQVPTETPEGGPVKPTRRPTPGSGTGATPTATPAASDTGLTPTPTPTRPDWASVFWADKYTLEPGECTNLHWSVENVVSVYLNDAPVTGKETRQICPTQTTSYTLRVVSSTGTLEYPATIVVNTTGLPTIDFTAEAYQVVQGGCTVLHWRVTDVRAVYLNDQGVPGESSQKVCPEAETTYELRVEDNNGATTTKRVVISILPAGTIAMRFWADQYTLRPDTCTTLHWNVQNVREVYLDEQGVAGVGSAQACPSGSQFYTLRAVDLTDTNISRDITLVEGNPLMSVPEVIAQGIVNDVAFNTDVDPTQPGDQNGYNLVIDGITPLFVGTPGWMQAAITLGVPQSFIQSGNPGPVDWPINPGQQVEFRAVCDGSKCVLTDAPGTYLYLRSE